MKQRTLFPILLVGLPIGLALSVVAALYLYYNPLDLPGSKRGPRAEVASYLRRSPNEKDLRDYRRILTSDLALTADAEPSRRRAVANWIASTLGPSNLGLPVKSLDPEVAESTPATVVPPASLVIEIPGTRQKNEVLVVVTGHHADVAGMDAAVSTSTLMSLAGAFTGTPQRRTLVLAFLGQESTGPQGLTPLDSLVQSLKIRRLAVRGILDLRVSQSPADADGSHSPRARLLALAPQDGQSWTGEVREAFAPRKPEGLSMEFAVATEAPTAAAALAGWRGTTAPYLLLWLIPAAPNDEASPLALAQSLEGVLQSLANQ